jgi:hypothetical protein
MNEFEKQLASQRFKQVPAEWRGTILKAANARSNPSGAFSSFNTAQWLRELFWPHPQAWAALAAVWIVIAGFHFVTPGNAPTVSSNAMIARAISVAEQRRELAELLNSAPGTRERSPADRPRSARVVQWMCV